MRSGMTSVAAPTNSGHVHSMHFTSKDERPDLPDKYQQSVRMRSVLAAHFPVRFVGSVKQLISIHSPISPLAPALAKPSSVTGSGSGLCYWALLLKVFPT